MRHIQHREPPVQPSLQHRLQQHRQRLVRRVSQRRQRERVQRAPRDRDPQALVEAVPNLHRPAEQVLKVVHVPQRNRGDLHQQRQIRMREQVGQIDAPGRVVQRRGRARSVRAEVRRRAGGEVRQDGLERLQRRHRGGEDAALLGQVQHEHGEEEAGDALSGGRARGGDEDGRGGGVDVPPALQHEQAAAKRVAGLELLVHALQVLVVHDVLQHCGVVVRGGGEVRPVGALGGFVGGAAGGGAQRNGEELGVVLVGEQAVQRGGASDGIDVDPGDDAERPCVRKRFCCCCCCCCC